MTIFVYMGINVHISIRIIRYIIDVDICICMRCRDDLFITSIGIWMTCVIFIYVSKFRYVVVYSVRCVAELYFQPRV